MPSVEYLGAGHVLAHAKFGERGEFGPQKFVPIHGSEVLGTEAGPDPDAACAPTGAKSQGTQPGDGGRRTSFKGQGTEMLSTIVNLAQPENPLGSPSPSRHHAHKVMNIT